jgi:hypothetical protein
VPHPFGFCLIKGAGLAGYRCGIPENAPFPWKRPRPRRTIALGTRQWGDFLSIPIHPELESRIRAQAEAQGLTVETYLERLLRADQQITEELESLALEGLNSGAPLEVGLSYWQEKHFRLDERLRKTGAR